MNSIYLVLFVLLLSSNSIYSKHNGKLKKLKELSEKRVVKRQILTNRLGLLQMINSGLPVNSASSFFSPVTFPNRFLIQPQQSQLGSQFPILSGQSATTKQATAAGNSTNKAKPTQSASSTTPRPTQFERFRPKFISPLTAPKDKFPDYCKKKLFRSLPVECRSRLESFSFNFG